MTSQSEDSDVTEITEKKDRTGTSGVEKQKQKDILLIQIKRRKRTAKIKVTNLRHEVTDIKSVIEPLWAALEDAQEILEEITAFYVEVEVKEQAVKKEPFEESEAIERDTTLPYVDDERLPDVPREGAPTVTPTSSNEGTPTEPYSLRAVPVWMKANARKIKINAIPDDVLNETFLNEEVTGAQRLVEPFQKSQVHILNDILETFQSMPLKIQIQRVDDRFSNLRKIEIKEPDRSHFRLLRRDLDANREPDVFEFKRVVFGKNSAAMGSQFVAQENARGNQTS
ncbi:hypothetical protein AWC38_SpisGene24856 [Stylophora pistillata]|uniref:Uncharacterized protein n=1 Tax=Stylophora pistillata TaxID=50429 RepID=A0A2B4R4J7_STYPI|nr:hypothetical protein AWC38_SpisGene24856 [Stylophora pistillata]